MELVYNFINTFLVYVQELWLAIIVGFIISGFFNEFIPTDFVKKFLGQKGFKPILISSLVGVLLPICCFGSLPVAVTMQRKGARLGPTLAFLVATPATSISALIVCWKLLGAVFTFYIFWAAIIVGLIMGVVGNKIKIDVKGERKEPTDADKSCCHTNVENKANSLHLASRLKSSIVYAFITLPKEIGLELLLGVSVASLIVVVEPLQNLIYQYLSGTLGYVFSLMVGLATYVCSTASVPVADAFIKNGMAYGATMVYLLVGPITSYGMIFVLKKKFGIKVLGFYLVTICICSVLLGIGFELLLNALL